MAKRPPKQTYYERSEAYAKQVSGEIIEQIKKGSAPWMKPWSGGAGRFAVRRWLRPTGNWTAPDHRRGTARSPARSKRSAPRHRRRSLRPLGRSRV